MSIYSAASVAMIKLLEKDLAKLIDPSGLDLD